MQHVSARFRTDRARVERMLPPPLDAADESELIVRYSSVRPEDSSRNATLPGVYACCDVLLGVKYQDRPGLLYLGGWTSQDWQRLNSREFFGKNVKDALVKFEQEGDRIEASLQRRGALIHRLRTRITDKTAPTPSLQRDQDRSVFVYRYRLDPDWTHDLVEDVELWDLKGNSKGPALESSPRVCDLEQTTCEWAEASLLDPFIELPAAEVLEVVFQEGEVAPQDGNTGEGRRAGVVAKVEPEAFKPWVFFNYDRPVTDSKTWLPKGWREAATAFKLTPEELTTYQARKDIQLARLDLVDIRIAVEKEPHAACLPPPCEPGPRPSLRVLALRVESSDLSPSPFNEIWLFAYCLVGEQWGWYALSHIATTGGDVIHGRETFGYPSKSGEVSLAITPEDFSIQGRRLGREFVYAEGAFRGISTGTSLAQFGVFGLRGGPFGASPPPPGRIIWQPWYFQGTQFFVDPESIALELPSAASSNGIGRPDPWFEFSPFRVASASVMVHAGMQRGPGTVVAESPEFASYYRERCDGLLPGVGDGTVVEPTFRIKRAPATQSSTRLGDRRAGSGKAPDSGATF